MSQQEHNEEKRHSDAEITEGTHPLAMVGIVGSIMSILCGAMCCLDPRLAGVMHTALGLLAVISGGTTFFWARQGRIGPSNFFQAKVALGVGTVGLLIGIGWLIWWASDPFGPASG